MQNIMSQRKCRCKDVRATTRKIGNSFLAYWRLIEKLDPILNLVIYAIKLLYLLPNGTGEERE